MAEVFGLPFAFATATLVLGVAIAACNPKKCGRSFDYAVRKCANCSAQDDKLVTIHERR
jgi:hypothetical protein